VSRETGKREPNLFDRFAAASSNVASGAVFFIACVALVVIWAPSYFIFRDLTRGSWSSTRRRRSSRSCWLRCFRTASGASKRPSNRKLDALADGLADLMEHIGGKDSELAQDIEDLKTAVGIDKIDEPAADRARDSHEGPRR
jgi:hypothetical protein